MKRSRLLAKRWLVLTGAAAIWWVSASWAPGYTFIFGNPHDPRIPVVRWDPEIWPPGATLSFEFVDSPDWALIPGVDGTEDAKRIANEALATWGAIVSADIRWEVGETISADELDADGVGIARNEFRNSALVGARATAGGFLMESCTIRIAVDSDDSEAALFSAILHEAGHCLGLGHPATYPRRASDYSEALDLDGLIDARKGLWPIDPVMSYGREAEPFLTADDRVGASLIRPRPGWKETTGTIGGAVFSGLDPAPYVNVLAIRICAGGKLCEGVSAFTGPTGGFAVEGLEPGRYVLWVHPLKVPSSIGPATYWEIGVTHVEDAVLTRPVEVQAGAVTGPVFVRLRPHEGRPP